MDKKGKKTHRETLIVHGSHFGHRKNGPLVEPIYTSAPFQFETSADIADVFEGNVNTCVYTRCGGNPTIVDIEERLALLEGGAGAICTSSGMSAIASSTMPFLKGGDNFVACATVYGGTYAFFRHDLKRYNMNVRFVKRNRYNSDTRIEEKIDDKTKFLFIETPTNPAMEIIDIELWARIAKKHKIPLIVDNTFATPYLQNPIKLGATIVVHSLTKYINGHGDVTAGAVICKKESDLKKIRENHVNHFGPMISPRDAYEITRGLKSLHLRMDRYCDSAMKIALFLQSQEKIKKVNYPGLLTHPGHGIASDQMNGKFGGMISFEFKTKEEAIAFIDNATGFINSVSLGDLESLITHPYSTTHSPYNESEKVKAGITPGLIRMSVGAENVDDLINHLEDVLKKI